MEKGQTNGKMDINVIPDFFETGKQLNLGKFPNTIIAEYGYTNIGDEFTLYLKGENIDFAEKCIGLE